MIRIGKGQKGSSTIKRLNGWVGDDRNCCPKKRVLDYRELQQKQTTKLNSTSK